MTIEQFVRGHGWHTTAPSATSTQGELEVARAAAQEAAQCEAAATAAAARRRREEDEDDEESLAQVWGIGGNVQYEQWSTQARAWDEFKDDHKRGSGNSKLKPCA